jgi:hypothetical protein
MKGTNKHYSLLHKVMDGNDFEMTLLEAYPCNSNCMQGHDIGRGEWQKMQMKKRSNLSFLILHDTKFRVLG